MAFSAKRWAYSDKPSFSSQSAICCIAALSHEFYRGLTVRPGDLLHGDEHGVTSIPLEIARDIPQASQAIEMAERRLIDYARSPACTPERLADMYGRVD